VTEAGHSDGSLREAYRICRAIARRRARNFYFAFLALPHRKRDAICAVYAFMRQADDISDDPSQSPAVRKEQLLTWLDGWHIALGSGNSADPVFVALLDARTRFSIPVELLDQLVQGTAMDLLDGASPSSSAAFISGSVPSTSAGLQAPYQTFDDLYRYCYLVASVVGLVCIRIFGYSDPRAEQLAEGTGIAFQLTNILRDVREDASLGRIYLPVEDMEQFGIIAEQVAATRSKTDITANLRQLLEFEAGRARTYYRSADALLPLIDSDARPALTTLVTIYRRLLDQIEVNGFDVFSAKISISTPEKLLILARGLLQLLSVRIRKLF
jgi:phytoene synthase